MVGVGRDLWGSPSPTPLPKQGHPQEAAQDLVQAGLEYLQRRRIHKPSGQPAPVLRHPQSKVLLHVQVEHPVLQFVTLCFRYVTLIQPRKTAMVWGTTSSGPLSPFFAQQLHFSSAPYSELLLELFCWALPCWPWPCLADPTLPCWPDFLVDHQPASLLWTCLEITGVLAEPGYMDGPVLFFSVRWGSPLVRPLPFLTCWPLGFYLSFLCEAAHSWCSLSKATIKQ